MIAAATLARKLGHRNVISFDMGGTTAKVCLIDDGRPLVSYGFEAARMQRFKKGSGLPLRVPAIEALGVSTSTFGAGMIVGARIALPALVVALVSNAVCRSRYRCSPARERRAADRT